MPFRKSQPSTFRSWNFPATFGTGLHQLRFLLAMALFSVFLATAINTSPAIGAVIFESANLGQSTSFGASVNDGQFDGVRFHLDDTVEVTQVGGNISSTGSLFIAIADVATLPVGVGNPFPSQPLAVTTFVAGTPSSDVRVPLPVTLPPGDYVLVVGTGLFGATGTGAVPTRFHGQTALPNVTYLTWNTGTGWVDVAAGSGAEGMRFVVEGVVSANQPPLADAGTDQTVECTDSDGALVTLAGSAVDPDGNPLTFTWDVPASVTLDDPTRADPVGLFPIGITTATLTVTDGLGGVDVDDVLITVVDSSPPEIACTTGVAALWPPNHQMVEVQVFIDATDACTAPEDLILVAVEVSSDEPDEGLGDGDTPGDVFGEDGFSAPVDVTPVFAFNAASGSFEGTILLRAERGGAGDGRAYHVEAFVVDTSTNLASSSCVVVVPHDRRKN